MGGLDRRGGGGLTLFLDNLWHHRRQKFIVAAVKWLIEFHTYITQLTCRRDIVYT